MCQHLKVVSIIAITVNIFKIVLSCYKLKISFRPTLVASNLIIPDALVLPDYKNLNNNNILYNTQFRDEFEMRKTGSRVIFYYDFFINNSAK